MSLKFRNILITGATGQLGSHLASSGLFTNILTPSRKTLDICDPLSIKKYFQAHPFDAVIHAAAMARMRECQKDPELAIQTNVTGTAALVAETLRKVKKIKRPVRFVYISTDGVYPGTGGSYKETDAAIPYNTYGWTKLGGECAVRLLKNHCIIRTRFFDPLHIPFKTYAVDAYSSNMPLTRLVKAIHVLLYSGFTGTINVGDRRSSDYALYKKFKPSIKPCRLKDIQSKTPFMLSRDASLNCSLWEKVYAAHS